MPTVLTQPHVSQVNQTVVRQYTTTWTSNSSGAATETVDLQQAGELVEVEFAPGSGGDQPTNAYDVTAVDAYSFDVLMGQGANLSNSAASKVTPTIPAKDGTTTSTAMQVVSGTITVSVSNAGNTKSGTIVWSVR